MAYHPTSTTTRHWLSSFIGLAALLLSVMATAAPTALDRERARAIMDVGDSRFEAGAYEAALEQYRAADAIMNVPTTGIEVGKTLEKLGRLAQARDTFRRVAELPVAADEPKAFATARQEASRLAAALTPRIPRLLVTVRGSAAGTKVELSIDGTLRPDSKPGTTLALDPGAHRVSARAEGYSEASAEVVLREGQAQELALELVATTGTPPARPAETQPQRVERAQPSPAGHRRVLLWTSAGVAAVGIAVGSVTGLQSLSLTRSVKGDCRENACPAERGDDISRAKTLANVSNIAFAVGALALAATGVQLWSLSREKRAATTSVSLGPGSLALRGAF